MEEEEKQTTRIHMYMEMDAAKEREEEFNSILI